MLLCITAKAVRGHDKDPGGFSYVPTLRKELGGVQIFRTED